MYFYNFKEDNWKCSHLILNSQLKWLYNCIDYLLLYCEFNKIFATYLEMFILFAPLSFR